MYKTPQGLFSIEKYNIIHYSMQTQRAGLTDFPIPPGGFTPTPPLDPNVIIPGMNSPSGPPAGSGGFPPMPDGLPFLPGVMPKIAEAEFVMNSEEVELPSLGLFYPNGKKSVMVQHLNAADENILVSDTLRRKGTQFDVLLRRKILDQDIDISTMLAGDKMAILIWLRRNGMGADYHVQVRDPNTGDLFDTVVDLLQIKYKQLSHLPDADGLFTYRLPVSGKTVRFRILNDKQALELEAQIESLARTTGGVEPTVTMTLRTQIQEIDGNKDKLYIDRFVENMQLRDSKRLQLFMGEVLPGLDMTYVFTNPNTGTTFQAGIPITMELFYPTKFV